MRLGVGLGDSSWDILGWGGANAAKKALDELRRSDNSGGMGKFVPARRRYT